MSITTQHTQQKANHNPYPVWQETMNRLKRRAEAQRARSRKQKDVYQLRAERINRQELNEIRTADRRRQMAVQLQRSRESVQTSSWNGNFRPWIAQTRSWTTIILIVTILCIAILRIVVRDKPADSWSKSTMEISNLQARQMLVFQPVKHVEYGSISQHGDDTML